MVRERTLLALGMLALTMWWSAPAGAEEASELSGRLGTLEQQLLTARLDALEQRLLTGRLDALEHQLQNGVSGRYGMPGIGGCGAPVAPEALCGAPAVHEAHCGCGACGGCGCGCCCDPCCRSQGFYGGVELSYLKAHNSSGTGPTGLLAAARSVNVGGITVDSSVAEIDPDFEPTPRLWIGYQRCDGLGVRLRYWEYDHSFDVAIGSPFTLFFDTFTQTIPGADGFHGWDTWIADIEVTDSSLVGCYWDVTWSCGFRQVEFVENVGLGLPGFPLLIMSKSFIGSGLTASVEVRRRATCNIGLFCSARASAIYGDEDTQLVDRFGPGLITANSETERNDVKYIWEAQLGVEYIMPLSSGASLFARAGAEVQYWGGFGVNQDIFDQEGNPNLPGDASVGFAGFFATVGLAR
jgi:hypothetical protein